MGLFYRIGDSVAHWFVFFSGFHERQLGLAQLILAKPKARQETPVVPLRLA
jgi:hypothetical protein